jgi:ParB family transcriptional regulator, chromosome partitioning protein
MKTKNSKSKLGKGMAALLGSSTMNNDFAEKLTSSTQSEAKTVTKIVVENTPLLVDINSINANKEQPRKIFREADLLELSKSIKENGVIQPLIVTEDEEAGKFLLIAGERRLRASKLAMLDRVPVVVKRATKRETLVMAIVENVQRADLNCVEEALSYYQLMEEFNLTQEDVAKKIGKERSSIANYLRILKLPRDVIALMQKDKLSFGHAKVLAVVKETEKSKRLANLAVENQWSVRELEKAIKAKSTPVKSSGNKFFNDKLDLFRDKIESRTGFHLGIKSKNNGAGQLTIKFNNEAEFNDIFEYLMK